MNVDQHTPEFLTANEVAHLLRITARSQRQSLLRLRRAGLPAVRILGKYLYPREATLNFLRRQEVA